MQLNNADIDFVSLLQVVLFHRWFCSPVTDPMVVGDNSSWNHITLRDVLSSFHTPINKLEKIKS